MTKTEKYLINGGTDYHYGRKTIAINDGTSIRADQLVPLPEYWQNDDGTYSHHYDAKRKWADEMACKTDLRLTKEWLWDK